MTIFTTDTFKLNLTHLEITFIEENTFFEKEIVKQLSVPFDIPKEKPFIKLYQFIGSHNAKGKIVISGNLFYSDSYYNAELFITSINENSIKAVIYFDSINLDILDSKLTDIDWPEIPCGNIREFATLTQLKNQSETPINFVRVQHADAFSGNYPENDKVINNSDSELGFYFQNSKGNFTSPPTYNTGFINYTTNHPNFSLQGSILRPFCYLKYIITYIFNTINFTVSGSIIDDLIIDKAILYHSNEIYHTNEDFSLIKEELTLNFKNNLNYTNWPHELKMYESEIEVTENGFFRINVDCLFDDVNLVDSEIYLIELYIGIKDDNGNFITKNYQSKRVSGILDFSLEAPIHLQNNNESIFIRLVCKEEIFNLASLNCGISGSQVPIYKDTISIRDLLPKDLTVFDFLKKVATGLNLNIGLDVNNKTLKMDFLKSRGENLKNVDLTLYQSNSFLRTINTLNGYSVSFDNDNLNIDISGIYKESGMDFENYDLPFLPLPIEEGFFNKVFHREGLRLLFYEPDFIGRPLYELENFKSSYKGFTDYFLKNWLVLLLNSEQYEVNLMLPVYIAISLKTNSKVFIYNNFFLVKKISRKTAGNLFTKITVTLFKIKN